MTSHRQATSGNSAIRVVIIDDDDFEREVLVDVLRAAGGFDVSSKASVFGLTNHLINEHVAVVVLDVMMPSIRGDKLAALLRKNPALRGLGVVLISSLPETELAQLMVEVQIDAFVSKANVRSQLSSVVRAIASRS